MMLTSIARAQDDGPIVIGERDRLERIRVTDFRAALDFSMRYFSSDVRDPEGGRRRETELEFREGLELSTLGYIGHPNLIEFDLLGRFFLTQRRESGDRFDPIDPDDGAPSGRVWTRENLNEFDLNASILQESDTPLSLYSRRSQTYIARPFGDTIDTTYTEHGARAAWRSDILPMQVHFFRGEQESRNSQRSLDYDLLQHSFNWSGQPQLGANQQLLLNYSFDDVAQTGPSDLAQSFRRHDALATHNLSFGESDQHNLHSTAHYFKESGVFDVDRLRIQELLRLRHTPRFETRYDYSYDLTRRPGIDQTIHRGSAGFRHSLFESLVTSAEAGASRLRLSEPEFTSTQVFGSLGAQYHKHVPLGRLTASTTLRYSQQEDSERGGAIQIINEPHTFSSAGFVVLQRRRIDAASIIVTDASGVFTFTPGFDYTVDDFVDRVEIRLLIGGDIEPGQAVLVSYQVGADPGGTTDTFGMRYTIRYDFEEGVLRGLGVYARYFHQDQRLSTDAEMALPPADIRELVFGADYRVGRMTLLGEHQIHKSTLSPFRATRAEARYTQPMGRGSSLVAAAVWNDIDRYEDDLRTQILSLSGRWNQHLSDQLRIGVQAAWRDERNTPGFDVQGFDQQVDLTWRRRQTTLSVTLRNTFVDGDVQDSSFQSVFVGLRREF